MEQKLNIAEILKNKPRGTKLYSMIHGKCSFEAVTDEIFKINFCTSKFGLTQSGECTLIKFGNMYDGGECIIFPSKEMRDWSKFAWEKGDVLIRTTSEYCIGIFDEWTSDDYSTFSAKFINLGLSDNFSCSYTCKTEEWEKMENSKNYISEIERVMNGKLNLQTLEIQTQPEFKDGDIVTMHKKNCDIVFIFNRLRTEDSFYYYAFHTLQTNNTGVIDCHITLPYAWTFFGSKMNFATDSEKQRLFDALAKEGKAWDAEKKQIVDLKPKCEFKPFDRVITRNDEDDIWTANIFSHMDSHGEYVTIGCVGGYTYCIPYNEVTAKLIGTTNNVGG